MQGIQLLYLTGRVAVGALFIGMASHAAAGNYQQTLSISAMTYSLEDLDVSDGKVPTYEISFKQHSVDVGSSLLGHEADSSLHVYTMRNKPLNTAFDFPGVSAAAAKDGSGRGSISAGLTLNMADYRSYTGLAAGYGSEQGFTLSPHSALTITATVDHSWFYDGALNPIVIGETAPQLEMHSYVFFGSGLTPVYSFSTMADSSGSKTITVTARFENPFDQVNQYSLSSNAHIGMERINYEPWDPTIPVPSVPEPGTVGMLLAGLPLILLVGRRRVKAAQHTRTPAR